MYYQLTLGEEPSYTDTFTARDWREYDRRVAALGSAYQEALEYQAPVEAYSLFEELRRAMLVNQLPQTYTPRVTVREVTHDTCVAPPRKLSPFMVFLTRAVSVFF